MGLFDRKDKLYSLEEALGLLKRSKYKNHTTIPVGNQFKLVLEEDIKNQEEICKSRNMYSNTRRKDFLKNQRENVHIDYSKVNTEYGQGYWQNNNYRAKNKNIETYR